METKIKLGSRYRSTIHADTQGIATAVTTYLSGCDRVALEYAKDGEVKCNWFDVPQVELVEENWVKVPKEKDRGGPGAVAPSRDPRR